jgi:surface protein
MANKKAQRQKKHLALVSLTRRSSRLGEMMEIINRKVLFVLVFTAITTLETALAVTYISDSNFDTAIETCLGTNPVDGLCSSSEYGSMPDWDVRFVTDMGLAFRYKSTFNGDIGSWNTYQVTDMYGMFSGAEEFNQDIGSWNTAQVTSMWSMFSSASAFNQDIGSWNTAQVTSMRSMFSSASTFNQDISSWTGTAATTFQSEMFSYATAFQAKYTCGINGPAIDCNTIKNSWFASPSPPPSSPATTLTGLLGLISASVVAFALL